MPILDINATDELGGVISNRGQTLTVTVDPFDVNQMLDIVMARLSGYNLSLFLKEKAHPQFADEIFDRFAQRGDSKVGQWEPLTDATQDIRRALGFNGPDPINVRTGDMFLFVTEHYDLNVGETYAEMDIPGNTNDPLLQRKLTTAQEGSDDNPLGYGPTPPRPVMAEPDNEDMQELLEHLQGWIMLETAGVLV